MSQVVQQEALTRLLAEKGVFSEEDFSEMLRVVDEEMKPITLRLTVPYEGR